MARAPGSPWRRLFWFSAAFVLLALLLRREGQKLARELTPAPNASLDSTAQAMADAFDASGTPDVGRPGNAVSVTSGLPEPERDSVRIAFSLDARGPSTYLPELLAARGGWNYRWPDRRAEPMRVWVQAASGPNWDDAYPALVREGFTAWEGLGLPLLFTIVRDSARAEVLVTWVERFDERMTGQTSWRYDQHGWIVGGNIQLALQLPDGRRVSQDGVRAITRHEVGHLLGLDHPQDTTSVMAAQVYVTELSERDRRTVRLAYELPPGRVWP
ncbi:MAG: matrixin family metalloprotease [Gemmatimonadaceae bacterium]|nr:matrixin family metalloprotease [Gemmatimonadaceae bacterium]